MVIHGEGMAGQGFAREENRARKRKQRKGAATVFREREKGREREREIRCLLEEEKGNILLRIKLVFASDN